MTIKRYQSSAGSDRCYLTLCSTRTGIDHSTPHHDIKFSLQSFIFQHMYSLAISPPCYKYISLWVSKISAQRSDPKPARARVRLKLSSCQARFPSRTVPGFGSTLIATTTTRRTRELCYWSAMLFLVCTSGCLSVWMWLCCASGVVFQKHNK